MKTIKELFKNQTCIMHNFWWTGTLHHARTCLSISEHEILYGSQDYVLDGVMEDIINYIQEKLS